MSAFSRPLAAVALAWLAIGGQLAHPASAAASQTTVTALVTDAYDGDTINVKAALWPDLDWTGSVRVRGVDTPEIRGLCEQEERLAIRARDYVRDLLTDESVVLTEIEHDRYSGRVLAHVKLESGESLAELLIAGGYGRAYDGGARRSWCGPGFVLPEETGDDDADDPYSDPNHPLALYDDNRNGRISCAEARAHGIAPVYSWHPAYAYMTDRDNDGVVCE